MNFVKKAIIGSNHSQSSTTMQGGHQNTMPGGRQKDGLDKAVDYVQEHFLHQGSQKNETAAQQAKDEKISDGIRFVYQKATGKRFPIKDKS